MPPSPAPAVPSIAVTPQALTARATGAYSPPIPWTAPGVSLEDHYERRRTASLLAAGVGALTLGTGAVAAGGLSWGASTQQVTATRRLVANTSSDREAHAEALDRLHRAEQQHTQSMRTSVILVSIGAGAVVAGIALSTLGGIRMRKRRRKVQPEGEDPQWSVTPSIAVAGAGLVLGTRF